MGWISRMIQRGNTVSAADASAAIHAYYQSEQLNRWADAAGRNTRTGKNFEHRAQEAYRQYSFLSQGLDWDDLEEIAR
jgi:hypothetical protein